MGNAVARIDDDINDSTAFDHIDVSEYDYDPDGSDWDYGEVNATVEGYIKTGSDNVFVNGKGVARKGDSTNESDDYSLGGWDYYEGGQHTNATGSITGGSSTVFANGKALTRKGDSVTTHANTSTTVKDGSSNVFAG